VEHFARVASSVIFVADIDRSIGFYRAVFGCKTTILDPGAALLLSPGGFQLYLIAQGDRTQHALGGIGLQYLIWAVDSAESLDHFERLLQDREARTTKHTSGGVVFLTAHDPDDVRVVIAHPSPQAMPRSVISAHMYTAW
jgi:catechol 2,3-dioxygenase-like lactoylglutathione lyase family enzyme